LSISSAAFAGGIIGLIEIQFNVTKLGLAIQAAGAFAFGVMVYVYPPAFS
jgi:hypothetical protein